MGGLQIRKGEKDGVQNHSFKNMGCKIAQLTKDKGKSAIKPISIPKFSNPIWRRLINTYLMPLSSST